MMTLVQQLALSVYWHAAFRAQAPANDTTPAPPAPDTRPRYVYALPTGELVTVIDIDQPSIDFELAGGTIVRARRVGAP